MCQAQGKDSVNKSRTPLGNAAVRKAGAVGKTAADGRTGVVPRRSKFSRMTFEGCTSSPLLFRPRLRHREPPGLHIRRFAPLRHSQALSAKMVVFNATERVDNRGLGA